MSKLKDNIDLFKLNKLQLIKKINSLELRVEELEDTIKDELYKTFMGKLQEPQELNRYKKENTNLRKKIKILKNLLKGEK
nr:MAG TPA: hypothetical protein [Caudoviricetes sp.]